MVHDMGLSKFNIFVPSTILAFHFKAACHMLRSPNSLWSRLSPVIASDTRDFNIIDERVGGWSKVGETNEIRRKTRKPNWVESN